MKKNKKSFLALLAAGVMALNLGMTALAADSVITYQGSKTFGFEPGSGYTATDLFDNFKNVMPGDELVEVITVKNETKSCDYIEVYMCAEVHDEEKNGLTYSESFEHQDGKDQSDVDGVRDESVATMKDFLSKLTMRIYNGETLIYKASPDEAGALVDDVKLGTLKYGKTLELKVELDVPIELDNTYANRVGEVDWVFKVTERNDPTDPKPTKTPTPTKPRPSGTAPVIEPTVTPETGVVDTITNLPKTGDETVMWPYIALLGIGVVGMALTVAKSRSKSNTEDKK